jgi:D-methionine transport system permease protein
MFNLSFQEIAIATWQTLYTVFISSLSGILFGLILGITLFLTSKKQALENKILNAILSFLVNSGRSLPFIILLISITPLTQLIVGTTIGTNAAIIPLIIAATLFFARIAENAFLEVPQDLFATANSLGATNWQLIKEFLLPESLSNLIKGATLTIISLIGYSAMAGAVGGGGLGQLAINYGYERFNVTVIIETVVILIAIVQLTQFIGNNIATSRKLKSVGLFSFAFAGICLISQAYPLFITKKQEIKVGVIGGQDVALLQVAQKVALQKYNLHINIVPFTDYVQPNVALDNGSIDANIFQHVPYLNAQIKAHNYHISSIAKTFVYPFGFYSNKYKSIADLPNNAIIAIPNDPSNEGRALLLLQKADLITLPKNIGLFPTPKDIISNKLNLQFVELNAAQIPRSLNNVALGGLTNDYAKPAGFTPTQATLLEGPDSPYANIIAVRTSDINNPILKKLVAVIHSPAYTNAVLKEYPNGAAIKAYKVVN